MGGTDGNPANTIPLTSGSFETQLLKVLFRVNPKSITIGCIDFTFEEAAMKLVVDVFSDVICPWCYIGKRRLEKATTALEGQHDIQIHWHPFQLNPTMPKEGISRTEYRTRKFGSWKRSLELDARVIAVGKAESISFAFDKTKRTPNTVDAHRLIWLAGEHGCQDTVVEALFQAYFTEGQDISSQETLTTIASAAGVDQKTAKVMFGTDDGMDIIANGREMSERLQVTSVPFFVINQKIALSGAQEPEVLLDAFQQVSI